jgi:hypothetical protein
MAVGDSIGCLTRRNDSCEDAAVRLASSLALVILRRHAIVSLSTVQRVGSPQGPGQPASPLHACCESRTTRPPEWAGRIGPTFYERLDTEDTKTVTERFRAAAAPIRLRRSSHTVAEPIDRRRPDRLSRGRQRERRRGGTVFPRRDAGSAARFLPGGVRSGRLETTDPFRHIRIVSRCASAPSAAAPP